LKHHVEVLKWDVLRVNTAKGPLTSFLELIKDPKVDSTALRTAASNIVRSLSGAQNNSLTPAASLIDSQLAEIDKRALQPTYEFGIGSIDYYGKNDTRLERDGTITHLDGTPRLMPGTKPGYMTCVTGVSGSGKTPMALHSALHMSKKKGRRVTFGAYEVGSGMSLELMAAIDCGFSRTDLMQGRISADDRKMLRTSMEQIADYVTFDSIPFATAWQPNQRGLNQRAMDRIAQSIIDSRCEVFIADLFRRTLKETRPEDEEAALAYMQSMAKDLNVHLIFLHQLNLKTLESSKSKIPTRDVLKGAGAWVEYPDTIEGLALHDVAPVAGGVADAQQDRLVLVVRAPKRLLAPGIPVHGVVGVLQQVRAGRVDQPVRTAAFGRVHGVFGFPRYVSAA
jgi:hypothetical protein